VKKVRTSNGRVQRKNKPSNGIATPHLHKSFARSKITNSGHIPGLDNRGTWSRRLRDVIALIAADRGGGDVLSEATLAVIRRASVLIVELEQRELRFAEHGATDLQLEQYSRVAGNLRRMLESIGLDRVPKDITPDLQTYVRMKSKRDVVDAEAAE
jgi:hypothetical protein